MQTLTSTSIASSVIDTLLGNLKQYLREGEVQAQMVSQLNAYSLFCIHACWDVYSMQAEKGQRNSITYDDLRNIPHLGKDTLMPKEISQEQSQLHIQNRSNISITNLGTKKTSLLSTRNGLTLSSRPHSLLPKSQRYEKGKQVKEKQVSQCIQLKSEVELDDPEIQKLRERTEIRLQYDSDYRKLQLSHEKSYKSKSEVMTSFLEEEPSSILTHDYDGEQMKGLLGEDKIKHYSLRMGVGPSSITGKDKKRTLQPLQSEILLQKNSKERQPYRNLRPMEMPLFQQPKLQPKMMNGVESYRLNEYKKHFARGYSRLDNLSKTIDYSASKEQDDPFTQKRHLVDTLETSGLGSSSLKSSRVTRRLALPKLHGRYKVLDRYEQQ